MKHTFNPAAVNTNTLLLVEFGKHLETQNFFMMPQAVRKQESLQEDKYRHLLSSLNVTSLTYNPAVPALQGRGGTGDRTVGAVLVASLARHGRGEGGAGAPCGG